MLFQHCLTASDEVVEQVGCLLCRHALFTGGLAVEADHRLPFVFPAFLWFDEQRLPLVIGVVMGRCAFDVLAGVLHDEQVAVLDASDELHAVVA